MSQEYKNKLKCPFCDTILYSHTVLNTDKTYLRIREDGHVAATSEIKCGHCDKPIIAWFTFDGLTELD